LTERPRIWPVFVTYAGAFIAILAFSILAAAAARALFPDLSDQALREGLTGLLAGGIASSTALLSIVLLANRGVPLAELRLLPGRESGRALLVMVVGMLALGQLLDSLTMLAGLGQQGAMALIRRALAEATGPSLFAAVVVIGVLAGSAEEIFFRGYMQTRLGARLPAPAAIAITSACFAVLHVEWLHAVLAFVLGLYLGWITELSGSALPAVVCHVVNNALFTMLTAVLGTAEAFGLNVGLAAASALALAGCVLWLRHDPAAP
jgi:membrane protease YdiL (CAAX protease family)